jgi:hypothetical protein
MPNAVTVQMGSSGCTGGDLAAWGTSGSTIEGVVGDMFSVGCGNGAAGGPWFNVNSGGATGFYSDMKCCGIGNGHGLYLDTQDFIKFPTGTGNCELIGETSPANVIKITNDTSGGCTFNVQGINSSSATCTDANSTLTQCSSVSTSTGQVSCALSALTCTATATVRSGATCVASYDGAATTVTFALLLPLEASVSSTTLSVKMQAAATGTGTAAADYWCP